MSSEELEQTIQSLLSLLEPHFRERARRKFKRNVKEFQFTATQTTERMGASGRVLVSNVYYQAGDEQSFDTVALKFFQNSASAITEIRNAMDLEVKFRAAPEFGIPRVIFASTKNPVLIIYEGIIATNYDEIDVPKKAWEAGRLLATIHGGTIRPVETALYRDLSRMIGQHIAETGMERDISQGLRHYFEKMEGAQSGCNPFSDFHQSNVMIAATNNEIDRCYVIDPEFMQTGSFDRLEDTGTFFGHQLYQEYVATGAIDQARQDLHEFLNGYDSKLKELGAEPLRMIYPRGNPVSFFIAQWAIMDALDIALNRGGDLKSAETLTRLNFAKFILNPRNEFQFPVVNQ